MQTIANRAYRVELSPKDDQRFLFEKHADASRWTYNWGLQRKKENYEMSQLPISAVKRNPTTIDLHRELIQLKHSKHPWLKEVSKWVPQMALRDLDAAFKNFFEGRTGFPRFKSRKRSRQSFRLAGNSPSQPKLIEVAGRAVKLPFLGWVRIKHGDIHYTPAGLKINNATVSETAGRWFLSLGVEAKMLKPESIVGPAVGIDRGIGEDNFMVISDGKEEIRVKSSKPLRRHERKLKRLDRQLSRKEKGSNRRKKAKAALARKHFRISNIRRDFIHKVTTWLAGNASVIVVEDLAVKDMMRNHCVAKSFADASHGEVVRQLAYKTEWGGSRLVRANPAYTSQDCSGCCRRHPEMKDLRKTLECECGLVLDRDRNAARNLVRSPEVIGRPETPVENDMKSFAEAGIGIVGGGVYLC